VPHIIHVTQSVFEKITNTTSEFVVDTGLTWYHITEWRSLWMVALLNIVPLGTIIYGENTQDGSEISRYFSHQILTQVVQYLARLRSLVWLTRTPAMGLRGHRGPPSPGPCAHEQVTAPRIMTTIPGSSVSVWYVRGACSHPSA
jgi:hypothetical protein